MEKQEEQERSDAFRILDSIEAGIKNDAELQEAYADVKRSILRYYEKVESQEHRRSPGGEVLKASEAEESDFDRKIAHDALIDRLNILSRLFVKKGIEPYWRTSWGSPGTTAERRAITRWVEEIAPVMKQEVSG